ncbi:ferritin-like domain-containing protein [Micromonospora sonneratiae]|jgi:bacterioferritin|uniref:Ferritin-like domain-containing protein n=1 Tax=Micromonospora sonneratiae TaxID=1184706 RepID=A0ABW3YN33_9ACTN
MPNQFALDVTKIRDEARQRMEEGPVTATYGGDTNPVLDILNQVVATEIVCYLRYTQNSIAASGIDSFQVATEFQKHAAEELQHALRAADRIDQLGGVANFDPEGLARRAITEYSAPAATDLKSMLQENLVAERIVISAYQEIIRWIGDADPTTRRLMEKILEEEEDHANDLTDLLGV